MNHILQPRRNLPRRTSALLFQFLATGCIVLLAANVGHAQDTDGDGIADGADNAPTLFNPSQSDLDGDGIGDVVDVDVDGDGIPNDSDNAPLEPNPGQEDADGDGWGDVVDPDPGNPSIPENIDVAELNGPYFYHPGVDSFVFLSAAGSDTPISMNLIKLLLDLDNDGQYDDLTQFGPSSLTISLNLSQLQSFGLDQLGQHPIGLRVGSATDSAILHVVPEPTTCALGLLGLGGLFCMRRRRRAACALP